MSNYSKESLKGKRYSIILALMGLCTVIGLTKLKPAWKSFSLFIVIGSLFGWSWQIFVTYLDPVHAGWWYLPHKVWGYIGLVSYEDIVFYPICGALFYLIKSWIPSIKLQYENTLKWVTFTGLCLLGLVSLFVFNIGGKSSTYWFLIPGLLMWPFCYKNINLGNFLLTGLSIVTLASVWDLWIKDWIYITPDLQQSKIWLDYATHKWAWINRSPVEITPWFSICGWIFIYPLACLTQRKVLH